MKKIIIILLFLPMFAFSATGKAPVEIALTPVKVNVKDHASLIRGAKFFANNCMSCHTMRYLRHNKLAAEAGITLDNMPLKNKEWFLGITPPDLTLVARRRSPDWIYTYLHSFYLDSSRPTGSNNLLVPNSSMTNILAGYQGTQKLSPKAMERLKKVGLLAKPQYYSVLEMVQSGSMSADEFNRTMTDLVNFLVYASDPKKEERHDLGYWVIGFLIILFIFAFLLKRIYWKKVK